MRDIFVARLLLVGVYITDTVEVGLFQNRQTV